MALGGSPDRGGRPRVILVDTTWRSTDYLAYQLAKRGLGVHAFTPALRRPRYLRLGYPYQSFIEQPLTPGTSDAFRAMVDTIGPVCIIPCTEQALYWLWDQPQDIQRLCLPDVSPDIQPLLLDRALLLQEAATWGVPVPEAMPLESRAECDAAIAAGLPLVVKSGQSVGSYGVALCCTADKVVEAFERFTPWGLSVTAQRFYTGPTFIAGGLFVQGEAVHFYAGEKTIMWPELTGYAYELCSTGEPHLSRLLAHAESICKQLGWTGLASFDFVLDENGEFRFVDFNPRYWGAAEATLNARVDLYDGLARWIRDGSAGSPSRPLSGVPHRIFPRYTFEPSGMSAWRRLAGMRDAPWDAKAFVMGEVAIEAIERSTRLAKSVARVRRAPRGQADQLRACPSLADKVS